MARLIMLIIMEALLERLNTEIPNYEMAIRLALTDFCFSFLHTKMSYSGVDLLPGFPVFVLRKRSTILAQKPHIY